MTQNFQNFRLTMWLDTSVLILLWYALSSLSNATCKILLAEYGILPITMTVLDLIPAFCIAVMDRRAVVSLIYTKYHKISLIALSGLLASYLHRVALSVAHLSTVHAVKAVQPIFSAILCSICFSESFSYEIVGSLLAIVVGVVMSTYRASTDIASISEDFRLYGICSAVISTFFLATSSVLSRRIATKKNVTQNTLYSASRLLCIPIAVPVWTLFTDGFVSSTVKQSSWSFSVTLLVYLLATLGQQLVSLATLVRLSAVSHAVLSSLKRVCVIIVAIVCFGNKISSFNALGICIAAFGAWRFSVTRIQTKVVLEEEASLIS